jgi:hypothetical protein
MADDLIVKANVGPPRANNLAVYQPERDQVGHRALHQHIGPQIIRAESDALSPSVQDADKLPLRN